MNYYAPICIVNESALEAIFEYSLCDRPEVIELADRMAKQQDAELEREHIELALVKLCPEKVH